MAELNAFFKQPESFNKNELNSPTTTYSKAWEKGYDLSGCKLAIIGIVDSRHITNIDNVQNKTVNNIRKQLSNLILPKSKKIIDLGDLVIGKTVTDSYYALYQVIEILYSKQIIPIIIGCSDDYIYGIHLFIKDIDIRTRHLHVDYKYDNSTIKTKIIDLNNYFYHSNKIHKTAIELNLLGIQAYYSNSEDYSIENETMVSINRLGWIRQNLFDTEPLFRNANIVTFDMNSVKISDNPSNNIGMPNGLYAEEICQLSWYAGYSGQTNIFGIFNYFSHFDHRDTGAALVAQIIWHFVDGYSQNPEENPEKGLKNFIQLHVHCETISTDLLFIKSKKTGRYWLKLKNKEKAVNKTFLPVSKKEYYDATNNKVSDHIIQYLTNKK